MAQLLEELTLDGFQVVRASMFTHFPRKDDPTCSIGPTRISFSKCSLSMLNNCDFIRIEVNPEKRCILVVPVNSSDRDSIRWTKGTAEKTIRSLESKAFGTDLYRTWNLDPGMNYRASGRLVSLKSKVMMLFDFSEPEIWANSNGATK